MKVLWWAWGVGAAAGVLLFQRRARADDTGVAGDDSEYPGLDLVDLRGKAPAAYIVRDRPADEVDAVVLHQTVKQLGLSDGGPGWHAEGGVAIPETWR